VFVNHGLEGSPTLRQQAELLAEKYRVSLTVADAIVPDGPDLEGRARHARYRAIESLLRTGEVCATAHTSDDQAETVLMRLARGSGSAGLSGIPSSRGPFRRPLLGVTRADLRAIAVDHGLPFSDDPHNSDDRFLRTRIRHTVIPTLENEIGPEIRDNLATSAFLIGKDDKLLTDVGRDIQVNVVATAPTLTVSLPVGPLVTLPDPIATRAVRRALTEFHRPYAGAHGDVASVLATAVDGTQRNLSGDLVCAVEQGMVILTIKQPPVASSDMEVRVGSPVTWGSHTFGVYRSSRPSLSTTVGRRTAIADTDTPLRFVAVSDGDKIEIEGGSARVVEVLRNAGVPARIRPFWLAIAISGKIAAIHGIRAASWARPTPGEPAIIIEREGPL
jgi:tRNA(Ile)-lysidine synthetase-like protein